MTAGGKLGDAVHADLQRHFDAGAIVELVLTAAFYNCVSRILLGRINARLHRGDETEGTHKDAA